MRIVLVGGVIGLLLAHAALVAVGAFLMRRTGVPARWAMLSSGLIHGVVSGLTACLVWPLDSSIYANLPGVLLGDWVYGAVTGAVAPDRLADAHNAVMWMLRVPQVYVPCSVLVSGGLGAVAQWIGRRHAARG